MTAERDVMLESPLGPLRASFVDGGLTRLHFVEAGDGERAVDGPARDLAEQLDAYWRGRLDRFDVSLHLRGTPFQLEVWDALQQIPYGATATYGEIARAIGRPHAVRAVGRANGQNPVAVLVPCHRVVGASGALSGYAAGLGRKQALLALERRSRKL